MSVKKGSSRDGLKNVKHILSNDEILLRLLYYLPKDAHNPAPLSDELENILEMNGEEKWNIIEERIVIGEKTSNLEDIELCKVYISMGRRRPHLGNMLLVKQEIIVSINTHENYSSDARLDWIKERINLLLLNKRVAGIGGLDLASGDPRVASRQYQRYDMVFVYLESKGGGVNSGCC